MRMVEDLVAQSSRRTQMPQPKRSTLVTSRCMLFHLDLVIESKAEMILAEWCIWCRRPHSKWKTATHILTRYSVSKASAVACNVLESITEWK